MEVKDKCGLCGKEFTYDSVRDTHLFYDPNSQETYDEFHIVKEQDWPSRRYNDRDEYVDLSGSYYICQDCYSNLPPDYRRFVEHLWEYERIGVPVGFSDLVRLAKQYRTPIPRQVDKKYHH